jgi:endonuclease/exonuclease/phosphatase family metal-dependent hydrolase
MRVMTYNIRHGLGNDINPREAENQSLAADVGLDLGRIATVIRSVDPDIVALQELDRFWTRSAHADQPAELAAMLRMNVCFGVNLVQESDSDCMAQSEYGVVILSKHPIHHSSNSALPALEGWEPRGLLEARVGVADGGEVLVLNTHLQVGGPGREQEAATQRREQARRIAHRVAQSSIPVVLMGDFNADPDDDELASLRRQSVGLQDAWKVAGNGSAGLTIPAHPDMMPANRIDAIFATSQFRVVDAFVLNSDFARMASDHLPVVADLVWAAEPEGDA